MLQPLLAIHNGSSSGHGSADVSSSDIQSAPNHIINRVGTSATIENGPEISTEDAWDQQNLLSLDGGGIRGYWSLLVLEKLMENVAYQETKQGSGETEPAKECGSFAPHAFPEGATHEKLTKDELESENAHNGDSVPASHFRGSRKFLPCHYFDYICGTSTGSLIAIMLGRFRMSVLDCLGEYERMGNRVFGKPRPLSRRDIVGGQWCRYSTEDMKSVLKDVIARRSERAQRINDTQLPSNPTMCKVFVTSLRNDKNNQSELKPYLFRSYDHERKQELPLHPNGRVTTDQPPMSSNRKNYGQADTLKIWQVAMAAIAAPSYFKPVKISRSTIEKKIDTYFSDGGFSHRSNPTDEGIKEIEELHSKANVGLVVSVGSSKGTGKPTRIFAKRQIRRAFEESTDTEKVHDEVAKSMPKNYWRLNDSVSGMHVEFDEWEPRGRTHGKEPGEETLKTIKNHFNKWANDGNNERYLRSCAKALVERRKARAKDASKWEAYATGAVFLCTFSACPNTKYASKYELENHLRSDHFVDDDEDITRYVKSMTRRWQYQTRPRNDG
ncbi:unnamed protein product [Periconia digitata]|uniref:PNPLA domain-containing protein n=1 Tax=Periconia digitata TaxID=1303443 RepID=A0A9W4UFX5_9PLEO|nr:unnamed protein product [Periconia digitata]